MKEKGYLLEITVDGVLIAVIDLREVAFVLKGDNDTTIVAFKNRDRDLSFDHRAFDIIANALINYNS